MTAILKIKFLYQNLRFIFDGFRHVKCQENVPNKIYYFIFLIFVHNVDKLKYFMIICNNQCIINKDVIAITITDILYFYL